MAHTAFARLLLAFGILAAVRADPSASDAVAPSNLRGSASGEVAGRSLGEPAAAVSPTNVPEERGVDVSGDNHSEIPQNATGAEEAADSLIVCRGGKVCHGGWTWSGHVRVCRGGFYCRGGAVLLLAEASEGEDQEVEEAASAPADLLEGSSEHEGEPMSSAELMKILTNTSEASESLIVCRGARVCRGGWTWWGGVRSCRGGFFCRPSWR